MSSNYSIADLLPLPNSNVRIPRLGFGVYRSPTNQCVQSCLNALKAGYRHIDTAQLYGNEKEVGEAIQKSGIPRSEIFVTTKILSPGGSPEATYNKLLASVEKIAGKDGYVDLFLIHSSKSGPAGRKELWQALEKLLAEGKTKSIGVSNYGVQHIEEMKEYAKVWPPHVNQLEVSVLHCSQCSWLSRLSSTISMQLLAHIEFVYAASRIQSAAGNRRVLQEAWNCCRSLFAHCAKL